MTKEEAIEILKSFKDNEMQRDKLERDGRCGSWKIGDIYKCLELDNAIDNILSDYKRVLKENEELLEVKVSTSAHNRILELEKENEELTIINKEIDKECSRLEEKEVKLINENEHYKDLIYALKTYYDITEEDLEKCIKNDR